MTDDAVPDPIGVLLSEHRRIERLLVALERCAATTPAPVADLRAFVAAAREVVDRDHHGKEEDLLFAALVDEGGAASDQGLLARLLDEHEQGRHAVAELEDTIEGGLGSDAARRQLGAVVARYAAMLRAHILAEDGAMFPLAARVIPAPVLEDLGWQFEARAQAHDAVDALIARYG